MFLLVLLAGFALLIFGGRKTLRGLAHVLSVLLVLPGFLFAGACVFLDRAIARGTSGGILTFLDTVLVFIGVMMPWGALVLLVCLSALAAAGFRAKWRRAAAGIVGAVALASVLTAMLITGWPSEGGQWWCYSPGLVGFLIAAWLFFKGRDDTREFTLDYPGGLRISRSLDENALRRFHGDVEFTVRELASGWKWYYLPSFQDASWKMGIVLGFHQGALRQIDIYHDEPAAYARDPSGARDNERRRAAATRRWVVSKGFRLGSHPWGEIWSSWDPRSDFGGVGIRYTLLSDVLPDIQSAHGAADQLGFRSAGLIE